jgi:hypothetical protein
VVSRATVKRERVRGQKFAMYAERECGREILARGT